MKNERKVKNRVFRHTGLLFYCFLLFPLKELGSKCLNMSKIENVKKIYCFNQQINPDGPEIGFYPSVGFLSGTKKGCEAANPFNMNSRVLKPSDNISEIICSGMKKAASLHS